jgi:branched-chain amino acid transport system ATP-binding protein
MSFFKVENLGIRFGGVVAVDKVGFDVKRGECYTIIGPKAPARPRSFNPIGAAILRLRENILNIKRLTNSFRRTRSPIWASRVPFQNIEPVRARQSCRTCLSAATAIAGTSLWQELLFTPRARGGTRAARGGGKVIDFRAGKVATALSPDCPTACAKWSVRRALATEPKLLLLDEPSSGPTRGNRQTWRSGSKTSSAPGVTVLMVEHDMNLCRAFDRVLRSTRHGGSPKALRPKCRRIPR